MDEEELEGAVDGAEHLQTSQASRRLTALSAAMPNELVSHVQVGCRVLFHLSSGVLMRLDMCSVDFCLDMCRLDLTCLDVS